MHLKNSFNYCPKCGNSTIKYNSSENFIQCDYCGFQLFINAAAAVAAIIIDNKGRILFTKRAHNPAKEMLDLPGGFVDVNESAEDALHREIKEELNIELESVEYFTTHPNQYTYNDLTYFTLDITYICKAKSFKNLTALDDISDYTFLKPEEVNIAEIGLHSIKKIVEKFLLSSCF
ncbi:MAG: NUDIX domain-containing protein [Bacteroidota bacterium]|nr:NUDIX domain-containing protein [Bacteroidota bacterium]